MSKTKSRVFASLVLLGGASAPAIAIAQTASTVTPPVREYVDDNGVDLLAGTIATKSPAVVIGDPALGGLTYQRLWSGGSYRDSTTGTIAIVGSVAKVSIGSASEAFDISGTTYTAQENDGSTLTSTSGVYTYTTSDGTVSKFYQASSQYAITQGQYDSNIYLQNTTRPDGTVITYYYKDVNAHIYIPGSGQPTNIYTTVRRLQSVVSSAGYMLKIDHAQDTAAEQPQISSYLAISKVTGLNTTIDSCAAQSDACTLPAGRPAVTISPPATPTDYTDGMGVTTRYGFASSKMTSISRVGSASTPTSISYSGDRVSSVTRGGVTTTYSSTDSNGERTVTITRGAASRTSVFTIATSLLKSSTAWGYTTAEQQAHRSQFTYSSGNVATATSPEGIITSYQYDARGNVTSQTTASKTPGTPANITTLATYPATCASAIFCNKPDTTTDARLGVTNYSYDPTHGGITVVKSPPDANGVRPETRYGYANYSGIWRLTSMSTCRTSAACFGGADETKTSVAYTGGNRLPTSRTIASGDGNLSTTTTVSYDAVGNVASTTDSLGNQTNSFYNSNRALTGVVSADPDGAGTLKNRAINIHYDTDGRIDLRQQGTASPDGSGFSSLQEMATTYDTADRKTSDKLSAGGTVFNLTQYSYDALGRPLCTAVRMDPAQWAGQTDACIPQTSGGRGPDRVKKFGYGATGQVTSIVTASGTSDVVQEVFEYSTDGKMSSATDGKNNVTAYTYDGFDRLLNTTYPGGSYEQLGYDSNGNITSRRKRDGRSLTFGYDALNRLTSKGVPDGRPVFYRYDLTGAMTEARFDSLSGEDYVLNAYDALGRVTSSTTRMNRDTRTLGYGYDLAGNRTRITHPDGVSFRYDYDNLGRLSHVLDGASNELALFAYLDNGQLTWRGHGANGTGYGHDALGRVISYNMQRLDGNSVTAVSTGLDYNAASQITEQRRSSDAYAYPDTRNVDNGYVTNGLNQYTSVGPNMYTYDANGNLTSDGGTTYSYDAENRLTGVSGARNGSLIYDPAGRLWETTGASGATQFLYDGDQLVAEYNNTGGLLRRYVQGTGNDDPILWYEGSSTSPYRLFTDHLGSIIGVIEDNGTMRQINTYDEYGVPGSSNIGRFQYTGQTWIPEIRLYYYKARMYSPMLGRFMQTDPIGYGDGMNVYNYAQADSVNNTDPTGLCGEKSNPCPLPPVYYNGSGSSNSSGGSGGAFNIVGAAYGLGKALFCGIFGCGKKHKGSVTVSTEPDVASLQNRDLTSDEKRVFTCNGATQEQVNSFHLSSGLPLAVKYNPFIDAAAVTIPSTFSASSTAYFDGGVSGLDLGLVAHEFSHHVQFGWHGKTLSTYALEASVWGYTDNPQEVGARADSKNVVDNYRNGKCQ